jgi:hypothetical protein
MGKHRKNYWWFARGACYVMLTLLVVNWLYQAMRKPSEWVGPFDRKFYKNPEKTWAVHGDKFRKFSTEILTPDFLAALAQTESSGNSIARVPWIWRWAWNPLKMYSPESSAVGLFQITDSNFSQAKHYCIHHGRVVAEGPWYDIHSCWFNGWYNRLIPSHATELTSAYLQISVNRCLAQWPGDANRIPLEKKQELAALIHLCGAQRGEVFVRHHWQLATSERCGAVDPQVYWRTLRKFQLMFRQLEKKQQ